MGEQPIVPKSRSVRSTGWFRRMCEALAYVLQPRHLKKTIGIALVVGLVLTLINQFDVIVSGDATTGTWVKCGLNFVVPFVVSNLGLLSGRKELLP